MLVEVVQLRFQGAKLSPAEVEAAPRHRGNLTVSHDGYASLHLGENPALCFVVGSMTHVRLGPMRGDDFMLIGTQYRHYGKTNQMDRQAWWCRALGAPHLPEPPWLAKYPRSGPDQPA